VNALLVLASSALCLGGSEGLSRLFERSHPTPKMEVWTPEWRDHFYTLEADDALWPPDRPVNRDGVHDRSHPVEKAQDTWRVVFLGDSVAAGFGTKPEEAFPRVLQARLNHEGRRIEVLNVAVEGWSTRQERIAYGRIARRYHPDQVIVAVCLNDIVELEHEFRPPPRWLVWLHRHSALVRRVVNARAREEQAVRSLFRSGEGFELLFEQLRGLEEEVRADQVSMGVVVLPFRFQVKAGAPPPTVQKAIAEFCGRSGVPYMDLLPIIRQNGESMFIDEDHFSPGGSRVVAEAILRSGILSGGPSFVPLLSESLARVGPKSASAIDWIRRRPEVPPKEAIGPLVDSLCDNDGRVRAAAAWALGQMGPSATTARPALTRALRDPEERVRSSAAQALARLGQSVEESIPELLDALADPRASVRWEAAQALWNAGVISPQHISKLAEALKSDDEYIRAFSVRTLGRMGPAAEAAVPALIDLLKADEGYGTRGPAAALRKIGPAVRRSLAPVLADLKSEDSARRARAALLLGKIGPEARDAVPDLMAALQDPDQEVASNAAFALGNIGAQAEQVVPVLVAMLRKGGPWVRVEAALALGKLRPNEPAAIAALAAALRDQDAALRAAAARALGRIGRAASTTVPTLRAVQDDPDEDVQAAVSWALEQIG
jgi:HEAT repeat protein/lysophospholipase L1-like esterase